jgi:hypothetical protein
MSHFAIIDENNIVAQVLVIEQDVIDTGHFGDPKTFVQTSYNTRGGVHYGSDGQPDGGVALRKNYAGIGYSYDKDCDAFIPPKPFASWVLDEETCYWEAPVAMPDSSGLETGTFYVWDEDTVNWKLNK